MNRPSNGLVVNRRSLNGVVCLSLNGEVDLANASDLRAHLKAVAQNDADLIVDLAALRYIDSSGIYVLMEVHETFKRVKRRLALAAPAPNVRKILDLLGIGQIVPVFATVEAALRDLGEHA